MQHTVLITLALLVACGSDKDSATTPAGTTPTGTTPTGSTPTGTPGTGTPTGTSTGTTSTPTPPVAAADAAQVDAGRTVVVDVAANDVDPDGSLDLGSVTRASASGRPVSEQARWERNRPRRGGVS